MGFASVGCLRLTKLQIPTVVIIKDSETLKMNVKLGYAYFIYSLFLTKHEKIKKILPQ